MPWRDVPIANVSNISLLSCCCLQLLALVWPTNTWDKCWHQLACLNWALRLSPCFVLLAWPGQRPKRIWTQHVFEPRFLDLHARREKGGWGWELLRLFAVFEEDGVLIFSAAGQSRGTTNSDAAGGLRWCNMTLSAGLWLGCRSSVSRYTVLFYFFKLSLFSSSFRPLCFLSFPALRFLSSLFFMVSTKGIGGKGGWLMGLGVKMAREGWVQPTRSWLRLGGTTGVGQCWGFLDLGI